MVVQNHRLEGQQQSPHPLDPVQKGPGPPRGLCKVVTGRPCWCLASVSCPLPPARGVCQELAMALVQPSPPAAAAGPSPPLPRQRPRGTGGCCATTGLPSSGPGRVFLPLPHCIALGAEVSDSLSCCNALCQTLGNPPSRGAGADPSEREQLQGTCNWLMAGAAESTWVLYSLRLGCRSHGLAGLRRRQQRKDQAGGSGEWRQCKGWGPGVLSCLSLGTRGLVWIGGRGGGCRELVCKERGGSRLWHRPREHQQPASFCSPAIQPAPDPKAPKCLPLTSSTCTHMGA